MKAKSNTWSDHIRQQKKSGLTIQGYCERYQLSLGMFYYWKRKLSSTAGSRRLSFQEVELIPEQLAIPVFEVRLGGSVVIRIEGNVSPAFLRELTGC